MIKSTDVLEYKEELFKEKNMLTSTLGGLIKDYRIKKRLSQLEVSLRIGWKDTSRLSKIEQGRVGKPTRETLDKIIEALDLNEQEKGQMLFASGLIPNDKDAEVVLLRLQSMIKGLKFPIYLSDFAWNSFYMNDLYQKLYMFTDQERTIIEKKRMNWLEIVFSGLLKKVEIIGGVNDELLKPFDEHLIALFKYEQLNNLEDKWYKNLISKLSKLDKFREFWRKIEPYELEHTLFEFEINIVKRIYKGESREFKFYNSFFHVTFDPRFYLLIQMPANEAAMKFCSSQS